MFDPTTYTKAPVLDVRAAIACGHALVAAGPKHLGAQGKKLLATVEKTTAELSARFQVTPQSKDARPFDNAVDRAWGALHSRLDGYADLPTAQFPKAKRAAEIMALVFPGDDMSFLGFAFMVEWADSDKRLKLIDEQHLAKDIDALCGKEFLENLRAAHAAYGKALGITEAAAPTVDPKLGQALAAARKAIGRYSFHVASLVDEDDPESLAMVAAALAPIDRVREGNAHRDTGGAPGAPDAPAGTGTSAGTAGGSGTPPVPAPAAS